MPTHPRKLSEILKEMLETVLRDPDAASDEASIVALYLANVAWNESVGMDHERDTYRNVWESIEAENPELWNDLKSNDINAMIDELIAYKHAHYPDDRRRILGCGNLGGKIRVEWLRPAAPGVDVKWETQLYGMVRAGDREAAIRFLRESRGMSRAEAAKQVAKITKELGMV
jgi:hypothetical protein